MRRASAKRETNDLHNEAYEGKTVARFIFFVCASILCVCESTYFSATFAPMSDQY